MITVVNLGISNIGSVCKALEFLRLDYLMTDKPDDVSAATKILLPGVGSFVAGMNAIEKKQLAEPLRQAALVRKIPFFGICLGMQLMFEQGFEGGAREGLGLIRGGVVPLQVDRARFAVPHMGWNDVQFKGMKMFEGVAENSCFYFVHSYEAQNQDKDAVVAFSEYGGHQIAAAVEKGLIWAGQFHAERSQAVGLQVLKNFAVLSAHAGDC